MKKLVRLMIWVAALIVAATCITACSQWETPYGELDENGYNISVKFDSNGGMFAGANNVSVVDVFDLNKATTNGEGMKEITLIAPDDSKRGNSAFEITKNGCFLAGWYTERTEVVGANGETTYTYSGKWDFATDKVVLDPAKNYSSEENVLTLYAAWVPYYTFEFYAQDASGEFQLMKEQDGISLDIPVWNLETGKLDNKKFPTRDGYTFEGAYLDAEMTQPITDTITGSVNYETGTSNNLEPIRIYTTWRKGNWFKISTAKQFISNSRLDGCYEILADLDFAGLNWSNTAMAKGEFNGQIQGNGFKMSNITVRQASNTQMDGGLFSKIAASAVIENVTFENAVFSIERGCRYPDARYGLLAGSIAEGATFNNVDISGKIQIGEECQENNYYIGLLCSSGTFGGIDTSNIEFVAAEGNNKVTNIQVDANGVVTFDFVS